MARYLLIEEFHLSLYAPQGLREEEDQAIRQTLDRNGFRHRLRRVLQRMVGKYSSLAKVKVKVSR